MTIDLLPGFHLCRPREMRHRQVRHCRRCRARRRHVVTWFMWYGPMTVCCHCGAQCNDGEMWHARKRDLVEAVKAAAEWPTLPNRAEAVAWLLAELAADRIPEVDPLQAKVESDDVT